MLVPSLGRENSVEEGMKNPTPAFLPGRLHGQSSLAGYSPQGHKESDTTGRLSTHARHRAQTLLCFLFFPPLSSTSLMVFFLIFKKYSFVWPCSALVVVHGITDFFVVCELLVVAYGPQFPDWGSNTVPLNRSMESWPLGYQGSPRLMVLHINHMLMTSKILSLIQTFFLNLTPMHPPGYQISPLDG